MAILASCWVSVLPPARWDPPEAPPAPPPQGAPPAGRQSRIRGGRLVAVKGEHGGGQVVARVLEEALVFGRHHRPREPGRRRPGPGRHGAAGGQSGAGKRGRAEPFDGERLQVRPNRPAPGRPVDAPMRGHVALDACTPQLRHLGGEQRGDLGDGRGRELAAQVDALARELRLPRQHDPAAGELARQAPVGVAVQAQRGGGERDRLGAEAGDAQRARGAADDERLVRALPGESKIAGRCRDGAAVQPAGDGGVGGELKNARHADVDAEPAGDGDAHRPVAGGRAHGEPEGEGEEQDGDERRAGGRESEASGHVRFRPRPHRPPSPTRGRGSGAVGWRGMDRLCGGHGLPGAVRAAQQRGPEPARGSVNARPSAPVMRSHTRRRRPSCSAWKQRQPRSAASTSMRSPAHAASPSRDSSRRRDAACAWARALRARRSAARHRTGGRACRGSAARSAAPPRRAPAGAARGRPTAIGHSTPATVRTSGAVAAGSPAATAQASSAKP